MFKSRSGNAPRTPQGARKETPRAPRTIRPPAAPDAGMLNNAALAHLARYAATEAGLARVLQRKVDRWARLTDADAETVAQVSGAARAAIAGIVARLAASGALSDAEFSTSRARSLARAGRSRRAIGAHLASRGVPAALAADALPEDPQRELAAALIHARKRRMGAWRKGEPSPDLQRRELASFARAGFAQGVARAALGMAVEEAEGAIVAFRAGL